MPNSDRMDYNPSYIRNGKVPHGTTATVFCLHGFEYTRASAVRRCSGMNGEWSGEEGTCKEIDCGTHNISNGVFVALGESTNYASYATYKCNSGATMVPPPAHGKDQEGEGVFAQCGVDGKWTPPLVHCLLRNTELPTTTGRGATPADDSVTARSSSTVCILSWLSALSFLIMTCCTLK